MVAGVGTVAADASLDASLAAQAQANNQTNETVSAENLTDGGNVTIVNLGENVTINETQNVSPQEPVVFVGPNATSGDNVTTTANGTQFNVSQQYYLGGVVPGWQGIAPESIDEAVNPTLNLTGGQLYAITWVNVDGAPHNVVIENAQGNDIAATPIVSEEGATQTLIFRAPNEDGEYYCEVHPQSMRGDLAITMNATNATADA